MKTFPCPALRYAVLGLAVLAVTARAEPLAIDLTVPVPPAVPTPIEPGTSTSPDGHTISADSRSFFLDGTPWMPVAGEFHYTRYPRAEWRDELLKMKAGGIDIVTTYVFWIHQEEQRGVSDWSGSKSLRDFLGLCRELGLKAIVRLGPWCHGEVRNGGLPDWVQNSGTRLRTTDPAFLALVRPFYGQIAQQMRGLLWKDGGPVIGVQVDNECGDDGYLLALKKMARDAGVDVPLYTMTGWNGASIPRSGLLPVFGGYADGFWGGSPEDFRKSFLFTSVRDDGDLGAQMQNTRPGRNGSMEVFPYACAEIGPGMMSSYKKRVKIDPEDPAAMALVKLGSGSNLPGYYMYQGGMNPEGKTYLEEDHPNAMPVKDYDFQTALGAAGEVRPQFHLLREQHLLLAHFGASLARMPVFYPAAMPRGLEDFNTLRWSVRADDKGRGFLFFNNRQPAVPLPPKTGVQFALKVAGGATLLVPRAPVTIGTGVYGVWPVGLDCDGVTLDYATAQPLGRTTAADGTAIYFLAALPGVRPELAIHGQAPQAVTPGTGVAAAVKNAAGKTVRFVVLTPAQAQDFSLVGFAGRERAVLSKGVVLADGASLRVQSDAATEPLSAAFFPPLGAAGAGGARLTPTADGIFSRFVVLAPEKTASATLAATLETPAKPKASTLNGTSEEAWNDAAVYQLALPSETPSRRQRLDLHYIGDAARLYVDGRFYDDNFYNGDPMALALWRIPTSDRAKVRLKVLPFSEALLARLPESARQKAAEARASGSIDQVTGTSMELREIKLDALP